jgi:predicted dehydrogenase
MGRIYRVAIIGCGGIARLHAASLNDMEEVELVGIAEILPEALRSFGDTYGIDPDSRYEDYRELIDKTNPDVAVIATRADSHRELSIEVMKRGVHVLCEKPIAVDLEEADLMVDASAEYGVKLAINTQRHTDPVFLYAKKLLDDGLIGDLRMVRSECKSYTASVGMANIGAHMFDAMSLYTGPASWVFANLTMQHDNELTPADITAGDRETGLGIGDYGTILIGYSDGVTGESEYWEGTGAFGFEVIGTSGVLAIRGSDPVIFHTEGGGGKVSDPFSWNTIDVPLTLDEQGSLDCNRWGTHQMMRSLFHAIETNSEPACSGNAGREALEINHAAFVSAISGARAEMPLLNRKHPLRTWQIENN